MQRSFKKPRVKRVRPPKPIEAPKPERPRRSNLKTIYKDLISSDSEQRVNTLRRAAAWYDLCITYIGAKLEPIPYQWGKTQLTHKNAAELMRSAAIDTSNNKQKEEYLIKSIRSYEKLVASYRPPKIQIFLSKLKHDRDKLEQRRKKLQHRFGEFMKFLQTILRPKNIDGKDIQLKVDKLSVDHRIDSQGNITFNNKLITYLSKVSRKQGMLTAVIDIFPLLMEAAGMKSELDTQGHATGRVIVSSSASKQAVIPMLKTLNQYYMHNDTNIKLVRKPRRKQ
jgi:hypothetical protein